LSHMTENLDNIKGKVRTLMEPENPNTSSYPCKKRKSENSHHNMTSYQSNNYDDIHTPIPCQPMQRTGRMDSIGVQSLVAHDEDLMRMVFGSNWTDNAYDVEHPNQNGHSPGRVDPNALEKLCSAVAMLPQGLQSSFADQMTFVLTNPETYTKQADDMETLAHNVAADANSRLKKGIPCKPCRPTPLTGAILGAYLS
jgi:hypothetical protein